MRRVSLAVLVYLIWEERNRGIFDNTSKLVEAVFRKFQILFYTILYFHEKIPWLTMLHSDWIGWGSLMWMHVYLAPTWSILCWLRVVSWSLFHGWDFDGPLGLSSLLLWFVELWWLHVVDLVRHGRGAAGCFCWFSAACFWLCWQ